MAVSTMEDPYRNRPAMSYWLIARARRAAARDESIVADAGTAEPCGRPFRPYVYRGTGADTLTAFMDDLPDDGERLTRRQERMQMLAELPVWCGHDKPPPGWITAPQAAGLLGVSARTVERYKRALEAAERTGRPA